MRNLKDYWKGLLHGEQHVAILDVVKIILRLIIVMYMSYGIFYLIHGPYQLAISSAIAFIFSHINLKLFKTNRFILSFILTDITVLAGVLLNSLFVKCDCGFDLYIFALIPLTFFISYSLKKSEQYVLNPRPLVFASCAAIGVSYILRKLNLMNSDPMSQNLSTLFYFINAAAALFIIVSICKIYSEGSIIRQTSLEKENTKLGSYANKDALTGLQNRRYMEEKLITSHEKANSEFYHFSVLLCDIDDFKKINDTYGHLSGDKVLKDFSDIAISHIRDFDCASRWGGEEFLILIKGGIPIASLIAERINKAVSISNVHTESEDINYTVTIGVAMYKKGYSIDDLIEEADENLYIGKRSGKNCFIC